AITVNAAPSILVDDYMDDPSSATAGWNWPPWWRYHWGMDLFDYITVQAPNNDYSVNYPNQRPWQPNTQYQLNDIVSYYGRLYRCTATHTTPATAPSTTPPGPPPTSFTLITGAAAITREPLANTSVAAAQPNTADEAKEDAIPV